MLISRRVSSCRACSQILHYSAVACKATADSYANYLLHSFGFSHQQALSISAKLYLRRNKKVISSDSKFVENANSVVTLFHNLGFHQTNIRNIVSREPRLLASNVEKTLKPKIRALQDDDFSASDIIRIISGHPEILLYGLESTILPLMHILRQVMVSNGNVINIVEKLTKTQFGNIAKCLLPSVALVSSYGVPIELIRKQLLHQPWYIVREWKVLTRAAKKLEITQQSSMNMYGFSLISGMTEKTFKSKCQIFMSFGWTQSDIKTFIMKNGRRFALSDEHIKKKLDFLMNTLQLKPAYLISHNSFITGSLEKRIVPRHKILLILKEKRLLEKIPSLYKAIGISEPRFLKRFVLPFREVHKTYAELTGCCLQMLTQDSEVFISVHKSYANYLVNSLGFSRQQSLSISTKLTQRRKNKVIDFYFVSNANSVVTLFRNLGFNKTHIRNIVSKEPCLLASKVDQTLKPKIRVFQDENFSATDIIRVISRRPSILLVGLESTILPVIHTLKQVMGSVNKVVNAIEKWHFHAIARYLLSNVTLLSDYEVPIELIRNQLLHQSRYYVQNPELFKDIVMRVECKLGITRDSPMFLHGINLISGITKETFETKYQIFMCFGWTQSDIRTFIMKNGCHIAFSDECIKKLDFLMNELQLEPAYLKSHNGFITCNLEKTLVPRHKILLILKEKGLSENNPSLYSAIKMSEPCFLKRFVLPFKEVREAYAKLTGGIV